MRKSVMMTKYFLSLLENGCPEFYILVTGHPEIKNDSTMKTYYQNEFRQWFPNSMESPGTSLHTTCERSRVRV
jgi:general stress protein 26